MTYKPLDNYHGRFCLQTPGTGAATDADSAPTATAIHNGAVDATFALAVASTGTTGVYKITGVIPAGYVSGDVVQVQVAATVGGVTGRAIADSFVVDTRRVGDLAELENLDAPITSRMASFVYTAPDSATAIASAVWTTAERTLTDQVDAGLTEEQVTMLESIHAKTALITAGSVTVSSPVTASGNRITAKAGDTWTIDLEDLGNISTRAKLWFAVKRRIGDEDDYSLLFLEESAGLSVVDGEDYSDADHGSISVTDAASGALTINIDEAATGELCAGTGYWAIKVLSDAGAATTLVEGSFVVTQRRIAAIS